MSKSREEEFFEIGKQHFKAAFEAFSKTPEGKEVINQLLLGNETPFRAWSAQLKEAGSAMIADVYNIVNEGEE